MSMKDFVSTLTDEQKQALIQALSEQSVVTDNTKTETKDNKPVVNEDFVMHKNTASSKKKEPVRAKQNQWVDTGECKDVLTPDVERTPRTRVSPKKVSTKCYICGKTFSMDSRFMFGEYHRCDRCK